MSVTVVLELKAPNAGLAAGYVIESSLEKGRGAVATVLVLRGTLKLGEEGVLTLLTETGTRLNTAFLAAGLVDRLHLFISPQIMGSDAVPAFKGLPAFVRMTEVEVERYGDDLGLSSLLRDPWPPAQQ